MSSDPESPFRPERSPLESVVGVAPSSVVEFSETPEPLTAAALPSIPRLIPNLGHAAIFVVLVLAVVLVLIVTLGIFFGVALGLHWLDRSAFDQLSRNPLFAVPMMALGEIAIIALCFPLFGLLWKRPFAAGIHLNSGTAAHHLWRFIGTGIAIGIMVQWLSNYLPIPKSLPIDDFFKTPASVWVVAILGVFIAPPFEELAFRGFLLPSLANAWDWMTRRNRGVADSTSQPRWSATAIILAVILTSIPFTLIHAEQLAHAWAPLAVLFTVSVILCVVRIRTGSLAASILVHSSYNFSIFVTLFVATGGFRHLEKMHS